MATLWAADAPMTTAEVAAQLESGLAYNTVQTILTRLTAKGVLQRTERGRAHAYWPTTDEASSVAQHLRSTLSGVQDRARVLREFAATIDEDDARILQRWLSTRSGDGS